MSSKPSAVPTNNNPTATQTTQSNAEGQSANSNGINRPKPSGTTPQVPPSHQPSETGTSATEKPTTAPSLPDKSPTTTPRITETPPKNVPVSRKINGTNCDPADTSAVFDGSIRIQNESNYQIQNAINNWKSIPNIPMIFNGNGQPTVKIVDVNEPSATWLGMYKSGGKFQPSIIYLNTALIPPGGETRVLTHELGHAFGLEDGPQGIMGGSKSITSEDIENLKKIKYSSNCKKAGIIQHDPGFDPDAEDNLYSFDAPAYDPNNNTNDQNNPRNKILAEETDKCGNLAIMRDGYFDGKKGFGWQKVYIKHGISNIEVFKDIIRHNCPSERQGSQGQVNVYREVIYHAKCERVWYRLFTIKCHDTGETADVKIVVDTSDRPGLNGMKGVISMYCINYDGSPLCPEWVNRVNPNATGPR